MFNYLSSLFNDPRAWLMVFLIALPGRLMAISMHEFSHAWMASRCGDQTARMLGRVTINPVRHLDLVGTIMMLVFGFGWAKPVPVNPRNFRNYRRDDLLVSIAGVSMNFILFLLGMIAMYTVLGIALSQVSLRLGDEGMLYMLKSAPYMSALLITPLWGQIAGYAYDMLMYFTLTNLVLFLFNLIPMPPLDGYHLLNDLVLRRTNAFASPRVTQVTTGIMFALMFTGVIGQVIGFLRDAMLSGAGTIAQRVFSALGII